jgi:hypothetical protein
MFHVIGTLLWMIKDKSSLIEHQKTQRKVKRIASQKFLLKSLEIKLIAWLKIKDQAMN